MPGQKVSIQRQPIVSTFFRVELSCENIIACDGRRKAFAILSFPYSVVRIGRLGAITVHKIEVTVLRNASPQRMRAHLPHLIPTHLRHLKACTIGLKAPFKLKALDLSVHES